ncbi:hypothetical protein [Cypionkella sp.]|uniref:hypothetical protein n=1 Tax=Cypionkella sp. TaxID=2811411 RepID=UPI002AB88146|nr:hypothetical protein [Cypionkella sp.]MDZ4395211.1 hypothetical protein [Cypionkella sp.]
MPESARVSETATATPPKPRNYTAVIYVHGMGSQRRYEESARLIDRMDQVLESEILDAEGAALGRLREIKPESEPCRSGAGGAVTFVKAKLVPKDGGAAFGDVRIYESYWAPLMAGQKSAFGVLKWIARQAFRPLTTLRAPWRELHRLRRAALADLRDQSPDAAGAQPQDWQELLQLYDRFDKLDAQRRDADGSFDGFLAFLAERDLTDGELDRLTALARAWRAHYRNTEWQNGLVLITMLLGLVLAGLGLIWAAHWALVQAGAFSAVLGADSLIGQALAAYLKPGWSQAVAVLATVATALGFVAFLTDYMGDVEIWSTYEETNEKNRARAAVIETTSGLMAHVLADGVLDGLGGPNPQGRCERVVVVAHSLGTSVAHDALLDLRKCNLVVQKADGMTGAVCLKLISHFITMGSPIDKINYFFETVRSGSHRYLRVVETLRGDITTAPFSLNPGRHAKPWVHWINFWDEADVISGPLASPTGRQSFANQVDNVHVPSLVFPNPGAAHLAYFDNLRVLQLLIDVIFRNGHSYLTLPVVEGQGRDYAQALVGPGKPRGRYRIWFALALAVPWLAACAVIAALLGAGSGLIWAVLGLALAVVTLLVGAMAARFAPAEDRI